MAVQMETNEIPCRRLPSPKLWGLTPAWPAPAGAMCSKRRAKPPQQRVAWRCGGMIVAAARTWASLQHRNDQKLGTKLNVGESRMKAIQ